MCVARTSQCNGFRMVLVFCIDGGAYDSVDAVGCVRFVL